MNIQYIVLFIVITLWLFLVAMWVKKTTKIFLWNYVAWFSAIIAYLFVDYTIHLLDAWKWIKLENPDAVLGFLVNNKTMVIIIIYFIFFLLFYKSRLFDVEVNWTFKKILSFFLFPILTVVNLFFTMLLLINGPDALTYDGYQKIMASLHITNYLLVDFFNYIPLIIILVPILALLLFLEIHIRFPSLPKRKKKEKEIVEVVEKVVEEKKG